MARAIRSKNSSAVWTVQAICSKKLSAIQTGKLSAKESCPIVQKNSSTVPAICSKKFINPSSHPFKKIVSHLNSASYPIKKRPPLEWLELSSCSKKFINRSSYLLEKNKTVHVTSSFHWKVKCRLGDAKECIQSGWSKHCDCCSLAYEIPAADAGHFESCISRKLFGG